MRQMPERKIEKQLFERAGVLVDFGPNDRLSVSLQGPESKFSLTEWVEKELGYKINGVYSKTPFGGDKHGAVDFGRRIIWLNLESLNSPELLVLVLLHEVGHIMREQKGYNQEMDALMNQIVDLAGKERGSLGAKFFDYHRELLEREERSEREAWEWALEFLLKLYQEHGWNIAKISDVVRVEEIILQSSYLEYAQQHTGSMLKVGQYMLQDSFSEEDEKRITNFVQSIFNPQSLKSSLDQIWGKLS